jgi:hypothetical protein
MTMKSKILIALVLTGCTSLVSAQCFPNRHSTNFFDGWISCEPAENPNLARGKSHFIMYDYGKVYKLGQTEIWNTNDPAHLDWGMRDVVIDYSLDGSTWIEAGQYTFAQASGLSTYEGETGPHFNDIEARYLLITGVSNYGSNDCFGLSEFRVSAEEVITTDVEPVTNLACIDVTLYPNPFADQLTFTLQPGCSGDLDYRLYDAGGKLLLNATTNLVNGQNKSIDIGRDLPAGTYNLYLAYGGQSIQRSIVKINRS